MREKMKSSGSATIIFAALSLILIILALIFLTGKDRKGPEITFDGGIEEYEEGMDMESVLAGVSAYDEKDGDVTSRLVVEKIIPSTDGKHVMITYAASDSSNNFSKAVRMIPNRSAEARDEAKPEESVSGQQTAQGQAGEENQYTGNSDGGPEENIEGQPGQEDAEDENQAGEESQGDESQTEEVNQDNGQEDQNDGQARGEENNRDVAQAGRGDAGEQQAQEEAGTSGGNPVLNLSATEVSTVVGKAPAWVTVIGALTDDKDDYNTLFRNLVVGGDYKINEEGDHEITLYTSDSDGNHSDTKKLIMHVDGQQ